MKEGNSLQSYLQIWDEVYTARMKTWSGNDIHLSLEEIYRMAKPSGIKESRHEALKHLSRCPMCLSKWVLWRKAITAVEDIKEEKSVIMTYGMLKAAATAKPKEPVSIRSSCGRFTLGLLPQVDNPARGMVTLEAVAEEAKCIEGHKVTVCDRQGLVLLEGKLRRGRLARICDDLSGIDLTTWTVVVEKEEKIS